MIPVGTGPVRAKSRVTLVLILINVVVYLITTYDKMFISVSDYWVDKAALIPVALMEPTQWYRVITSMFLHGGLFHIFFNMYFLYFFGREVETALGSKRYLLLYLVSGLSASVFHTAFTPISGSLGLIVPAIGASGAISGVLGAYLLLYPRKVLSMCIFLPFPLCFTTYSSYFLLFWFAMQVLYGYARFGSSIAYFAHAGGFVAGITLLFLLKPRREYAPQIFPLFSPVLSTTRYVGIRGLSGITKAILAVLVASLLLGAVYSTFTASRLTGVYVVDIYAQREGLSRVYDQAVFTLHGEVVLPVQDDARVVFNRFLWADLLRGEPGYFSEDFVCSVVARTEEFNKRVRVAVRGAIEYDNTGILRFFNGTLVTDVLLIRYSWIYAYVDIEPNVVYIVSIHAEEVAGDTGNLVVKPFAALSVILSLAALVVALTKDKELAEPEIRALY